MVDPRISHRDHGLYRGVVTDNVDPQKAGTVEVEIAALMKSGLRAPVIMPGSPFNNGIFALPAVGAEVLVGFLDGEPDAPVVLGGFVPPLTSSGSRSQLDAEDLPGVLTIENPEFKVTLGKSGSTVPYFEVATRPDEQGRAMRVVMALSGLLQLAVPLFREGTFAAIELLTPGLLSLNGRLTQIRNRPVEESEDPI